MMFSLLLGLAIIIMNKQALGGVFMLNQDTWGKEEQCKELIIQHLLTFGKSQFDPEVVRNCITFLRSENLEHHENYPIGGKVAEKSVNEQMEIITTQPDSEKTLTILDEKFENSEIVTGKIIQNDFQGTSENKELAEKFKDPSSSEDLKSSPPEDDDVIEMYPENIIQEWPAVEMSRKRRGAENQELTNKKDTEAYVSPGRPPWELHTPEDDMELDQRSRTGTYQTTTGVKATTKKVTVPVVSPRPPSWEKHTALDDINLDERSRNRAQNKIHLVYFNWFINWFKTRVGLGPKVIQV